MRRVLSIETLIAGAGIGCLLYEQLFWALILFGIYIIVAIIKWWQKGYNPEDDFSWKRGYPKSRSGSFSDWDNEHGGDGDGGGE